MPKKKSNTLGTKKLCILNQILQSLHIILHTVKMITEILKDRESKM